MWLQICVCGYFDIFSLFTFCSEGTNFVDVLFVYCGIYSLAVELFFLVLHHFSFIGWIIDSRKEGKGLLPWFWGTQR